MDADAQKLVDALRHRASTTKAMLVTVLDAIDAAKCRADAVGAQLAGGGGDAAPELAAALKDLEAARRRAAELEAGSAESNRELERLRDTTTKQRLRNKAGGYSEQAFDRRRITSSSSAPSSARLYPN